ncbi:trafficking protein Mon1 [Cooperia oncophora]
MLLLRSLFMSSSGGLSNEEFLVLQEQLIALRNRNYELQEALQKKNHELTQLSSPRSEALQFANKLINRREGSKEKEITQRYEAELDALRMKLTSQEEEFRLQQETLIAELNKIVAQNETLNKELEQFKADGSIYSSPQAGTPCDAQTSFVELYHPAPVTSRDPPTEVAIASKSSVGTQCDGADVLHGGTDNNIASSEPQNESKSCQTDEEEVVSVMEKLLEYEGKMTELRRSIEELSSENTNLSSIVQDNEAKVVSLQEELKLANINLAKKDEFISCALRSISNMKDNAGQECIPFTEQCIDIDKLNKEVQLILECISNGRAATAKVFEEKTALEELVSDLQAKVEASQTRLLQVEEAHEAERARANEEIQSLSEKLLRMQDAHDSEVKAIRRESATNCDELKAKIAALEESESKFSEDKVLLLETRYQLELADREKLIESERKEMHRKLNSLEASLLAKDEEKALALKKQAALIKELQRAVKEEKKRAESMEKLGRCSSEERGWHLVGETGAKSAQTLDGADSRSVSSASALESDNFELISRLTSLQRTHAETLDRINALESENARLHCEINEKSELIEHWIRRRPLAQGTGVTTPSKTEGTFRKLLLSTLPSDEATNDIKEMNKKLQRMLEETLSKNIILQRLLKAFQGKDDNDSVGILLPFEVLKCIFLRILGSANAFGTYRNVNLYVPEMLEIDDTPGGVGSVESSLLDQSINNSGVTVNQIEVEEEDAVESPVSAESVLDRLSKFPYQVFVLSEYGRPIFVSCGHEDQLCSLFALIGVFVSRVKLWGDRLLQLSSGDVHVRFCHRSSLILCIVSRSYELLDDQLNVLFDQIVSTLSRSQLDIVYKKKGDNYDLRRLLRGTDKYMDSSVSAWRSDISLLQSAIRVLPMQPSDRDFLSSTMVACITAAKLDGVLFGLMIAHRQVAAMVKKKIVEKLENNAKFFPSFKSSVESPVAFSISQIGTGSDVLWSFVYKNRSSRQVCISGAKMPLISRAERISARTLYERISHLVREEPHMRCLFLKRNRDNVLVWVTDKFELQCVFSPLVSAVTATTMVDRLLKTLKYHEQRYFIIHTPSF